MRTLEFCSPLLAFVAFACADCHRIADDNEVPEWIFQAYSSVPITSDGSSGIYRYTFYEDRRVELEIDFSCGGPSDAWELSWEARGPGELTLRQVSESETLLPGSDSYEEWILSYGDECDPIKLYGVRKVDGVRNSVGQLYRGAVCNAQVPPPDDWGGGEWDECEWFWCEMPPADGCGP